MVMLFGTEVYDRQTKKAFVPDRGKVFTAGFLASADPQVETTLYAEPGTYLLVWAKAVDAPLKAYATHQAAPTTQWRSAVISRSEGMRRVNR